MLTYTSLFSRFYSNAHHHGLLPQQLGVVRDLFLKTDPEGPSLIYRAAYPHGLLVHVELLIRVLLQHTMVKKLIFASEEGKFTRVPRHNPVRL
jgi:hypothetical protein